MNKKTGYLKRDESGHIYLVPEGMVDKFERLQEEESYEAFNDMFGEFEINSNIEDVLVEVDWDNL